MSAKEGLLTRYADKVVGTLGCYDRLVLSGTLLAMAHPKAMAEVLFRAGVRCFDLGQYLEPLREQVRQNAEHIAAEHGGDPGRARSDARLGPHPLGDGNLPQVFALV
jgi:hypothetical protein